MREMGPASNDEMPTRIVFEQVPSARSGATDVMSFCFAGSQPTRHGGVFSLLLLNFGG